MYKDPVQVAVRTILARSFIMFFNTFEYIQDPLTQLYGAQFPKQHEQMIVDCIATMDNECNHYVTFMQKYGSDVVTSYFQNNNWEAGEIDSAVHGHNQSQKELEQLWYNSGIGYL